MREAGNYSPGYDLEAMKRGLEAEGSAFTLFGGEPLLMKLPDLEEMLRWGFTKYGRTSVQTNGALITPAHVALFTQYKTSVGISVDGPGALNDSRWAGSLDATRAATAASFAAIDLLMAVGIVPSLIVTLYRGNAVGSRLNALLSWFMDLDEKGLKHVRLHALEIEDEQTRTEMALTEEESVAAFGALFELQGRLRSIQFDVFSDIAKLLTGGTGSCVWHGCDPLTTPAVRGVNGLGGRTNCSRTNKDGVDWVKADHGGKERSAVLYATPQADGGCQDCRFFFACQGQCPGTAIEGDWRNRSEQCGLWMQTFERIERSLLSLGQSPVSLDPVKRRAAEITVLEAMAGGARDHQDHWDAPDGYQHADGDQVVHGDAGRTTMHGDTPHGDSPHEDSVA